MLSPDRVTDASPPLADVCAVCQRRVGVGTIACRCRVPLCKKHVWSGNHDCAYDYKGSEQERLKKANPTVAPRKL